MKYISLLIISLLMSTPGIAQSLGSLLKKGKSAVKTTVEQQIKKAENKLKSKSITFQSLPTTLAELQAMPNADLTNEYAVAALAVAVLCNYEQNAEETYRMMDFLRGPQPLDESDKKFINEHLKGRSYIIRSYLKGTTPENNYTPSTPYVVEVSENSYSRNEEGYVKLFVNSSGADSPRPVTLRKKKSTGQWFVYRMSLLTDVRQPKENDPWD